MIKKYLLIFGVIAPLIGAIMAGSLAFYYINIWQYSGPKTTFTVENGDTFSKINYRLSKQNLIPSTKIFYRYAQFKKIMTKFRSGTFAIPNGTTLTEITNILLNGTPLSTKITIPEGKNIFEIADILEKNNIIKSKERFINLAKNPQFVAKFNIPNDRIEGYLYPDTYFFSINSSEESVIRSMITNFNKVVSGLDLSTSNLNLHQIITLASIVEKETGASFERPTISGVFQNRLKKRMRLQSDPTTIYGIFENFDGNLRKHHLQEKTDYNTYRVNGLPKGPIANPGLESIKAVLNPEKHDYLYFVSKNDGTHIFTKTYKEHLKAVEDWQKNRSNRAGKSWRDLQQ